MTTNTTAEFNADIMRAHGGQPYHAPKSAPIAERVLYGRDEAWQFPNVDAMIAAMRAGARARGPVVLS